MLLSERMKQVRKELQLSQLEVANVLGCKVGKIKQIEGGKTVSISFADAKILSDKFRINQRWLQDGYGDMFKEVSITDLQNIELDFIEENCRKIEFYNSIENFNSKKISGYVSFPNDFFELNSCCNLYAINLNCESMKPTILQNDLIIFDENKRVFIDSKIFQIKYNDKIIVKRLFEMPNNKLLLKSDNVLFPNIEVLKDEIEIQSQLICIVSIRKI